MSEFVNGYKDLVWTIAHASELSRAYNWKQVWKGLPLFVTQPVKYWFVWVGLAFGVICSVYIPFFWVLYLLAVGFILFKTLLYVSLYRPHSLYGMVRRTYEVQYTDGTTRTVVMWFPRWACQYESDPYGSMRYELSELDNSKVKYYHGVFPSHNAQYI